MSNGLSGAKNTPARPLPHTEVVSCLPPWYNDFPMAQLPDLPKLPPRSADSHKGSFGRLLVLAGSVGMTGAAVLCARAALRAGVGLVVVGTPDSCYPILASQLVCGMVRPLPETKEGTLGRRAAQSILEWAHDHDVLALGPGLSSHPETRALFLDIFPRLERPVVIDADGINILSDQIPLLGSVRHPVVLTPHPGEMSRLLRRPISEVQNDRANIACMFAEKCRVVVALKGHRTVVSNGKQTYVNTSGNPGMATAGSGDVLTGLIGALLGQGLDAFEATKLGVHIHGLAGDLAAERLGQLSLTASDLIDWLPEAFQRYG